MDRLLVIDDDPLIQALVSRGLTGPGCAVRVASSAEEGLAGFRAERPDVVLLDVNLPDESGLDVFRQIRAIDGTVPVIFITASSASGQAIEAIKLGSYDYLVKPLHLKRVEDVVGHALKTRRLMSVPVAVGKDAEGRPADALIGACPAMQEVYKAIGRVARYDVNVLIHGETGTGKELVARAIYQHSQRANTTFLAINCAAIPEGLLESELFGHEKGAFTGADRQHIGKFEQCNGGTLFLDEIGDMPLAIQAKILRVLQEKQFQRLGGREVVVTDVRVLAATHRDLEQAVARQAFRGDLYYRLNGFSIELPPLRERGEDVELLLKHLLRRYSQEMGREVSDFAADTLLLLKRYPWPGNVREMQNVVRQALLLCTGPVILPAYLPRGVRELAGPPTIPDPRADDWETFVTEGLGQEHPDLYAKALERMERALLGCVLRHTAGHQTRAAELLGITRGSLRHKLRSLGITAQVNPAAGEEEEIDS
jgi:two-component system nitrogen regulation response regulator GlnG